MDKNLDHLFGTARNHRLSAREREEIFRRLRFTIASKQAPVYQGSMLWRMLTAGFSRYTPLVATVMIFVLMGSGAALAQNTIPGDFLYPLKRMQERIHSSVRISAESKAHVEATHMERRLEEATVLDARGKLSGETSSELVQEYHRERREVLRNVQALEDSGSSQAAAALRARMNATQDRYERLFEGARRRQPGGNVDDTQDILPSDVVDSASPAAVEATTGINAEL